MEKKEERTLKLKKLEADIKRHGDWLYINMQFQKEATAFAKGFKNNNVSLDENIAKGEADYLSGWLLRKLEDIEDKIIHIETCLCRLVREKEDLEKC